MGLAVILYAKSQKGSGTGGTTGTVTGTTASYLNPATTATTTGTDAYSGIEDQVLGLQQAFLASQAANTTPTTKTTPAPAPTAAPQPAPTPYAGETQVGSGWSEYSPAPIKGLTGASYVGLANGTVAGSLERSGVPLYYQGSQGVFDVDTPESNLLPGTGLYQKAAS
jgi:hypothetical protein